ncbi:MAG: Mbeg1-like protein [Acutalibacteraceae bacterium]
MPQNKNSLYYYLEQTGKLSFEEAPFNEVDALIFAVFSYMDFSVFQKARNASPESAVLISDVYQGLSRDFAKDKNNTFKSMYAVSSAAAKTKRFGGVFVFGFEEHTDKTISMQFSACSFLIPNGLTVIAFRGTDGSIVGWKENFHLGYTSGVPAQLEAGDYAKRIASALPLSPLVITGHSKGGNLAVWAAAHMDRDTQNRIVSVYNNDGPGFCCDFIESANYRSVSKKIIKFVPASSIVGVLLESDIKPIVIQSSQKGLLQHLPESWEVSDNKFIRLDGRSEFGNISDDVMNGWISSLTYDERKQLSEIIFSVLDAADADTFKDLEASPSHIASAVKAFAGMDKQKRRILNEILKRLLREIRILTADKISGYDKTLMS